MKFGLFLLLSSSVALAATFPISMTNVRFTPASVAINTGDTVTWTDQQGFHDTVSGSSGAPDGLWNSSAQFRRLMQPGESYSVTFNNAGTFPYFCSPHWPLGMVGSVQVIAVNSPPGISISSPANGANFAAPADITVQASAFDSDGSVTQVQFSLNGTPVGSVSAPPYSVTVNDLGPGNYTFSAVATDNAGAMGNVSVSVTVSGQQPAITSAPLSQTVNGGSDITFTVQATGSSPLSYQWFFGQAAITGASAASLLLTNVSSADSGIYTVQVANSFGSTSASATLTVTNPPAGTPPSITTQPESQTVGPGTNVTFNAAAIGSSPLSWQWFFQGAPFVGATNSTLSLLSVMPANAGEYFAVASNAFGSTSSTAAALTVVVPPVCEYALSKTSAAFDAAGGFDSVTVSTAPNCSWTVSKTNTWIVIVSSSGGIGTGTVNFTVLSNATRSVRSGVVVIAGNTLTVTQAAPVFVARNDFNRDGQSDFLWQNADGRIRLWLLDGAARVRPMLLRNGRPVSRDLQIVGTHDFNADRNVDILWQHTSGAISIWFMNGTNFVRSGLLSGAPALASSWQVAGLGDFDQDGQVDFLFRHKDGYLLVWFMKGTRFVRQLLIFNGQAVPPAWRVAGVADVNNDRQPDVVWQHTDSSIVVWFMNGTTPASGPLLSHLPRLNAKVVGLNDLNQDGKLDFIWRHPAGQLSMWLMDGTNRVGSFFLKSPELLPSAWKFAAPRD